MPSTVLLTYDMHIINIYKAQTELTIVKSDMDKSGYLRIMDPELHIK